jgi:hypothetical protein
MSTPKVAPEKFVTAMEQEMQKYLQSVMQAVNDAPDGDWLGGSEEQVRDLSAAFRRQVFERAVQARVDAAEAAFSPSGQSTDRPATGQ